MNNSEVAITKASEEIIAVLEYLGSKFDVAIDWASQNILPYIEDIFRKVVPYKITTNSIGLCLAIASIITGTLLLTKVIKSYKGYMRSYEENTFVGSYGLHGGAGLTDIGVLAAAFACVALIGGFIATICFGYNLFGWILAPELKFVEHIQFIM